MSWRKATHRAAAARFRVSIKFVNDMVLPRRRIGSLNPQPRGTGGGHGKLTGVVGWIERRVIGRPINRMHHAA